MLIIDRKFWYRKLMNSHFMTTVFFINFIVADILWTCKFYSFKKIKIIIWTYLWLQMQEIICTCLNIWSNGFINKHIINYLLNNFYCLMYVLSIKGISASFKTRENLSSSPVFLIFYKFVSTSVWQDIFFTFYFTIILQV